MTTLFISGIDTGIGKTFACGALAHSLLGKGHQLATQKWVETGTESNSQDLLTHQKIAKQDFNAATNELHAPYLFKYPASPHLSARLENSEINPDFLIKQTRILESQYQHLIIEGAGGLCVPLNQETLIIDLIASLKLPVLLVTSGRLGSINHTILSLEICQQRGIEVRALIYNDYPSQDEIITCETRDYLRRYLALQHKGCLWFELALNSDRIELSTEQINVLLRE